MLQCITAASPSPGTTVVGYGPACAQAARAAAPDSGAATDVRTSTGVHTVTRGTLNVPVAIPAGANRARLLPLLAVVSALVAPSLSSTTKSTVRVLGRLQSFLDWVSVDRSEVTGGVICAYIVARSCPPVDTVLPADWPARPVLPATTASEVSLLRRAAKLGLAETGSLADALTDPLVTLLLRQIGANVARLTTEKKPLLWSKFLPVADAALAAFETWRKSHLVVTAELQIQVRDAFALAIALATGSRVSELLGFVGDDILPGETDDGREFLRTIFKHTKTRQTPFSTHQPFVTHVTSAIVLSLFDAFDRVCGWEPAGAVWVCYRGSTRDPLGYAWFAALVKSVDPECSPHSVRVTLATDLWAQNATVQEIMAAGRWSSMAAVLYVVSSLDKRLSTADRVGKSGLTYRGNALRSGQVTKPDVLQTNAWSRALAEGLEVDGDD